MRDVIEFFVELVMAIAGAVALSALVVGGALMLVGCAVFGGCWTWRRERETIWGTAPGRAHSNVRPGGCISRPPERSEGQEFQGGGG